MYSNRVISDDEIRNGPYLIIEELEGDILKNNKLKINAGGLTTSMRKEKDGLTFFGKAKSSNTLIDYELNYDGWSNLDSYVFLVYYRLETKKFYLKTNPEHKKLNNNLVIKLNDQTEYPLTHSTRFAMSQYIIYAIPCKIKLDLSLINDKHEIVKKSSFNSIETRTVSLGREKSCTIHINDKKFSKIHTTFFYDTENKQWKVKDGSDKKSTNGTWLYPDASYEILDNTVIEIGSSKLKIGLYYS